MPTAWPRIIPITTTLAKISHSSNSHGHNIFLFLSRFTYSISFNLKNCPYEVLGYHTHVTGHVDRLLSSFFPCTLVMYQQRRWYLQHRILFLGRIMCHEARPLEMDSWNYTEVWRLNHQGTQMAWSGSLTSWCKSSQAFPHWDSGDRRHQGVMHLHEHPQGHTQVPVTHWQDFPTWTGKHPTAQVSQKAGG